jgi:TldD protein
METDLFRSISYLKAEGSDLLWRFVRSHKGTHYCDLRFEVVFGRTSSAESGQPRSMNERMEASFGVSVHFGQTGAMGFGHAGATIGAIAAKPNRLVSVLRAALDESYERARWSARQSALVTKRYGSRAASLKAQPPLPRAQVREEIPGRYAREARAIEPAEMINLTREASAAVCGVGPEIVYDHVSALTELREELFLDSEGSMIAQQFAFSQGDCFVVGQTNSGYQENYDTIGQQRGLESLTEGWLGELMPNPDLQTFAVELAKETRELAASPVLKPPPNEVTVVTDPHFNALLSHEIVGHPCEADRALKMEAAYAGRSWLLRSLHDNEIGKQIGSKLLSACSDPLVDGYGHYRYDHEGTSASRVMHIDQGIFRGFLNSRATSQVLEAAPNGSARASEARFVPLIRMSNTFFMPGASKPENLIAEVEHGYYMCGNLIPSIAESRENFRISARRVYEIENGRLGRLYRAGSVMGDSRQFFLNVDGVGDDLRLAAIPNCGKGQPMQVKRMSNGGPTMRSRARLAGG